MSHAIKKTRKKMAFYKMEKLTQIDLSNNWLTYVDPYIFTDLSTPEWTVDVTTNPFICDCGIEGKNECILRLNSGIFHFRVLSLNWPCSSSKSSKRKIIGIQPIHTRHMFQMYFRFRPLDDKKYKTLASL